jgi:hypothetical protein
MFTFRPPPTDPVSINPEDETLHTGQFPLPRRIFDKKTEIKKQKWIKPVTGSDKM